MLKVIIIIIVFFLLPLYEEYSKKSNVIEAILEFKKKQ